MTNIKDLENRLWEAADHMRANSALRLNEFAEPVLGLIFLKFAGVKFSKTEKEIVAERKTKTKNYGGASVARERPVSSADYGQEKTDQTVRIAKMNLAIHGLSGDIRQGNTYYEDLHRSVGKFDFAMANPPFNVNGIDKERIKDDPRFPYGIPRNDNGNYLWIQIFLSALKNTGRAGFVMANSASDAGHSEKEIRTKMIDDDLVDVMVAVGPNMFYNVTLPVTLWFLDKGKKKTDRKGKVLFIDVRNIYHQIDRAHRDWTEEQIQQIADIVRSYRGEPAFRQGYGLARKDCQGTHLR